VNVSTTKWTNAIGLNFSNPNALCQATHAEEHKIRNVTWAHHMWCPECDRCLMSPTTWVLSVPWSTWNITNGRHRKRARTAFMFLSIHVGMHYTQTTKQRVIRNSAYTLSSLLQWTIKRNFLLQWTIDGKVRLEFHVQTTVYLSLSIVYLSPSIVKNILEVLFLIYLRQISA
jgi:hypothetical protein